MNVYLLKGDPDKFLGLTLRNEADAEVLFKFNGATIEGWTPLPVEADENYGDVSTCDFPSLIGHVPVFSARAVSVLRDFLMPNGQVLPLAYDREDYYAYNITNMLDALNLEQSEIIRFSTGRIMDIRRYEFFAEKLEGDPGIFKLAATPLLRVFVTEKFKQMVNNYGLTGFQFKLLWSASRS